MVGVGSSGAPAELLDALPDLRAIIAFGVGIEAFDVEDLKRRNISLTNCAGFNSEDVADLAIGHVIALARRFPHAGPAIAAGGWNTATSVPPQKRLRGKRLGIVGLGSIGVAVAERAEVFGIEIAWFGPRPKPHVRWRHEPDLKALATWSDFLVLCAPGGPETDKMIDAGIIAALGPEGILVNVARGSLVDEAALKEALRAGNLFGAGLDVFAQEPPPPEDWEGVPNLFLTPHIGGTTREALADATSTVLENVRRHFADEPLKNVITS